MRTSTLLNNRWIFTKEKINVQSADKVIGESVNLPHTWNAEDGQDGGNDYYRGTCWYIKKLAKPVLPENGEAWLTFEGAAMTADVYVNGVHLGHHEGGYSTFRVNITPALQAENTIAVAVNNGKNRTVYPQKADFTFYGGLYRNVHLLTVPQEHFALDFFGSTGLKITPRLQGTYAEVTLEAWTEHTPNRTPVTFSIKGAGTKQAKVQNGKAEVVIVLENAHLWDGLNDPYLYTAHAELPSGDAITARFGCRTFHVDPQKGFFLNGKPYWLCGAARHQDRQGAGSALTPAMQEEDMAILREMGATTVRLAHYQHNQYFYDLCDQYGIIAWAEIPYITEHMPEARANTLSQMEELVIQNYNHPSIICWGLSNEITVSGGVTDDVVENHHLLNDLCHNLDKTRPTTMAHAFMLETNQPFVMLPDICSYNLYYGWYVGEMEDNEVWFDRFHAEHPDAVIGLSEYGADANPAFQSGKPEKNDWTEGYQALYHEHMLKMWAQRPFIWAMHCWNLFDFGADGRNEGGKPGQNQKGLVTFDRKLKKDAFYIYKAYLSKEPFVHLCGRRYAERTESVTEIKVYSNQTSVTLLVDGETFAGKSGEKVFTFQIPICGKHTIEVKSGDLSDSMQICKVDEPNPNYVNGGTEAINWFNQPEALKRDGCFSILDSLAEIKACPAAAAILDEIGRKASAAFGDVAQNVTMPPDIQCAMDRASLQSMLRQVSKAITPAMVMEYNARLNQIKKSK